MATVRRAWSPWTSSPSGRRSTSTTAAACSGRRLTPASSPTPIDQALVHYVDVEGRRVRYLDQGTGHPLLLCHRLIGPLEHLHSWSPAFSRLRRVLIPV